MTGYDLGIPDHVAFSAFLDDLAVLGVTPVAQGGQRYAVIAARSNPRWWLLPIDNRRAAAAGLQMLQPVTRSARIAKTIACGVARCGPHSLLGRRQLRLLSLPDLDGAFGNRMAHVALFTGTNGPHRKTAIQVMDAQGMILGYAKLSRDPAVRSYIRNEAVILRSLAGLALESCEIPMVLAERDGNDLSLLVTDSLKNSDHTAPLEIKSYHLRFFQEMAIKTGQVGAAATLDRLEADISLLNVAHDWRTRLQRGLDMLRPEACMIRIGLAHGDFTPWNTFVQSGKLYIFDWEYANPAYPLGYDLIHFRLATLSSDAQRSAGPALIKELRSNFYNGDKAAARRALALSLILHAVFYLRRLMAANAPVDDWADGPTRAAMIDDVLSL
ncbi:hypothetical protein [Gemmobacter sp.]|uniref:hypothetical protein n=1 Tax=Gemmobacter sp. TaxID=1898957 RepID=UPI002AFF514F|nr:hypothetical protein [Gemmobacter sp.]